MKPLPAKAVALVALAGALVSPGCVSLKRTPEARYFTLRSLTPTPPAAEARGGGLVLVLPVRLPGHLDRPQLVVFSGGNELRIDEFLRWAEPLDAAVTRILAENLADLLPDRAVLRPPLPGSALPRVRVFVDLQRFGPEADGDVLLEGRYALLPAKDERPLRRGTLRHQRQAGGATPAATDPGAAVEIMNELLVEASREIAAALRSLPEAEASPSPTAAPPPQASPPRSAPQ